MMVCVQKVEFISQYYLFNLESKPIFYSCIPIHILRDFGFIYPNYMCNIDWTLTSILGFSYQHKTWMTDKSSNEVHNE